MTVVFRYVWASSDLVQRLRDHVIHGESFVVLGHRASGKSVLLAQVIEQLPRQTGQVIQIGFLGQRDISGERDIRNLVRKQVRADVHPGSELEMLGSLRDYNEGTQIRPILIATNVDALPYGLSRRFLQEVRTLVNAKQIIAVITGEYDLRELVYGPNSEFNVAEQYVLQGFENEAFRKPFSENVERVGLRFVDPSAAADCFWEFTGGSLFALRLLLAASNEMGLHRTLDCPVRVNSDLLDSLADGIGKLGSPESQLLRFASRLVPLEPVSWTRLEQLARGEKAPLEQPSGPPGPLTMSGIAVREGGFLRIASPVMMRAVQEYYDDRRFGDLYASIGNWPRAFELYEKLPAHRRTRPTSAEDRPDVETAVRSLITALFASSSRGVGSVRELFDKGCRTILGFDEVSFWNLNGEWRQSEGASGISGELRAAAVAILPTLTDSSISEAAFALPPPWRGRAFAAKLTGVLRDRPFAVLIGNFRRPEVVSQTRERLLHELMSSFQIAHSYACEKAKRNLDLAVTTKHAEILNGILARLGSDIFNVEGAARTAAGKLRELGYRRIGINLVTPDEKFIKGICDCSDQPEVDLCKYTEWPLDNPMANVQPWVVHTRRHLVVPDARTHSLTNKECVKRGRIEAFSLVPILGARGTPRETAIGTIHFERNDKGVPSQEEVDNFCEFANQFAALLEHSERTALLQSALNLMPDPVAIVDALLKVRFANAPAAKLLNSEARWWTRAEAPPLPPLGEVTGFIHQAAVGNRVARRIEHVGLHDFAGLAVAEHLDWRDRVFGVALNIHDLRYTDSLLRAFQGAANAQDVNSLRNALVDGMKIMGHKWARLYMHESTGEGEFLVSRYCYGFETDEETLFFQRGGWRIPRDRQKAGEESWLSIEKGRPVAFCFTEKSGQFPNRNGLVVCGIADPQCSGALTKHLGDYWLDVPLLRGKDPFGKITLQADANYSQERFDLLELFCQMTSELLDAFLRREEMQQISGQSQLEALTQISHNIATRFAFISGALGEYRSLESDGQELANKELMTLLKAANNRLERHYEHSMAGVRRAKSHLRMIRLNKTEFDLVKALEEMFKGKHFKIDSCERPYFVKADQDLLVGCVSEIILNAREALHGTYRDLEIDARIHTEDTTGGPMSVLTISDNGPGIPKQNKARIWDQFFTDHSLYADRMQGLGLGLGFVLRVLKAHGGQAVEDGEVGRGARFRLTLPRGWATPEG